MSKIVYISHSLCEQHNTGAGHPERPQRLEAINQKLTESGLINKIDVIEAQKANDEIICAVHSASYVKAVTEAIDSGVIFLDSGDTVVSEKSLEAAYYAVGAAITGIDRLKNEDCNKVFCAVRPPGHHAEKERAMGFCIFNNIAIAALYAQNYKLAEKILIVDWDVHHGNGTQHIFESDNTIFYYSMHQYPYYPGSGLESETGAGEGLGYTLNRPLPTGSGDNSYVQALEKDLEEIEKKFKADLVLISAGFDAHKDDYLAGMRVTEKGFYKMTELVAQYAWRNSEGKILSVLEGGYNLEALSASVNAHLNCLLKY